MKPDQPKEAFQNGDVVAASFLESLVSMSERLSRSGLCLSDVVVVVTLAQLFSGIVVAGYDTTARYTWVNSSFQSVVGLAREKVIGCRLEEHFAPAWCHERLALLQEVIESRRPVATVEIFRGRRMEGAVLPVASASGGADVSGMETAAVFIGRFGLAIPLHVDGPQTGSRFDQKAVALPTEGARLGAGRSELVHVLPVRCLTVPDWGPLSVLTRRELDVLRLIAAGFDNSTIAKRIHRTKRAVEWHIQKLYDYLNCSQRTDLFRFGVLAGLPEIDEEHWQAMLTGVPIA